MSDKNNDVNSLIAQFRQEKKIASEAPVGDDAGSLIAQFRKEKGMADLTDEERGQMLKQQFPLVGTGRPPMGFGEKVGQMVKNIPGSAWETAKGIGTMVMHPMQFGENLSDLVAGMALQTGLPVKPGAEQQAEELKAKAGPTVETAKEFAMHPVDRVTKAIIEDPVQSLLIMRGLLPKGPAMIPSDRAERIRALAETKKIPTTLAEETGSPYWQKVETFVERMPSVLGIRKFREKQLAAADYEAKQVLAKYIANPDKPDFWGNKEFIDDLYAGVRDKAAKTNVKVSATDTLAETQQLLDRYPSIFEAIQDTRTKGILRNIAGTAVPQISMEKVVTPTFTFDDFWMLRKGLGAAKETARAQGNIEAVGVFDKIKNAVDKDLDALSDISKTGITDDLRAANEAYRRYNVKYELMQNAYDKALSKVRAGGGLTPEDLTVFSPQKFSTELRKLISQESRVKKSGLFTEKEIDELSGTANIMSIVKRAGQFAENPPTGQRWTDFLMTGGLVGYGVAKEEWLMMGSVAGTAATMKLLTTTQAGKNLAIAASKIKPGTPAMQAIMKRIMQAIPAYLANEAAKKGAEEAAKPRTPMPPKEELVSAPTGAAPITPPESEPKKKRTSSRRGRIEDFESLQ